MLRRHITPCSMKHSFSMVLFLAGINSLLAVQEGDTYEQVLAEKGPPAGKMEAGVTTLLNYPDASIKIQDGRVVAVKPLTLPPAPPAKAKVVQAPVPKPKAPPPGPALQWTVNYAAALTQAKETNRHVFLFFTGSDWCGWCKRLDQEILSTPAFSRYAGENLILVKLDFPRAVPQAPDLKSQNQQLAKKYRIEGYPTVVVLDSSGKAVERLGYQEGGPEPFIERLSRF